MDAAGAAQAIKDLIGKRGVTRTTVIKDVEGNILTEGDKVLERWETYVKDLYDDDKGERPEIHTVGGPEITNREVERAIEKMKYRKAEGEDGVGVEMMKLGS